MTHIVKRITKRELLQKDPDLGLDGAFANWLDSTSDELVAFTFDGNAVVVVFRKKQSSK